MRVPGVSAYCHNAAAALVGGETSAAAQEERFTRIEYAPAFAERTICASTRIDVPAVGNCFLSKADAPVALATRCAAGFSLD